MARPKRFELLTPRFVVWCSIQLSYGRGGRIAKGSDPRWQGPSRPASQQVSKAFWLEDFHPSCPTPDPRAENVDGRDKAAHDGGESVQKAVV
jgi:hypothetical protein